jgi:SAM-dependent methyltransferase
MIDPTERFSDRVDNYVRYRPAYPPAVLDILQPCGLTRDWVIADVGSGPGHLTRLFLAHGNSVFGVEPNRPMREAGERLLAGYAGFVSIAGAAEATTLDAASVDLVTAGQAFHWFDPQRARAEFARILRPPRWVALIWNERRQDTTPFLAAYARLVREYATNDRRGQQGEAVAPTVLETFFGPGGYRAARVPNAQVFDFDGLRGRLLSSSYAPMAGYPRHAAMLGELRQLFDAHQADGVVTVEYDTEVYVGCVS